MSVALICLRLHFFLDLAHRQERGGRGLSGLWWMSHTWDLTTHQWPSRERIILKPCCEIGRLWFHRMKVWDPGIVGCLWFHRLDVWEFCIVAMYVMFVNVVRWRLYIGLCGRPCILARILDFYGLLIVQWPVNFCNDWPLMVVESQWALAIVLCWGYIHVVDCHL